MLQDIGQNYLELCLAYDAWARGEQLGPSLEPNVKNDEFPGLIVLYPMGAYPTTDYPMFRGLSSHSTLQG